MAAKRQRGSNSTSILVVDDHPIMRDGIAQVIDQEKDLAICGEADNAAEALNAIERLRPDMVIVDLSLSAQNIDGLELIKDIKIRHSDLPVLVLSMHDESFYAERALHAGACGYVMKQEPSEELLAAIRQVLSGRIYLSDGMTQKMLHKAGDGSAGLNISPVESLSDRELEVFRLLALGFKTHPIAEQLHLSTRTVESYYERIKEKLDLRSAAELAQYAVQWGRIPSTGKATSRDSKSGA